MPERFKNSWNRLQRAAHHARAFAAEWDAIFDGEPLQPELREDKAGWFTIVANFVPSAQERVLRNTLALELGELAYQLRAALDGLIWDTVTHMQGFEPPTDEANRLEFPILNGKVRHFDNCGLQKFPFPHRLKGWLESIQPGSLEKPIGDPDRGLKTTLEDVHNLARLDRHRRLRTIAAILADLSLSIETKPPGGKIVAHEALACDLLNGQNEIVRCRVECAGGLLPYNISLKAQIAFDISVEGVELYYGVNVMSQLNRFIRAVEHTIIRFEAELSEIDHLSAHDPS